MQTKCLHCGQNATLRSQFCCIGCEHVYNYIHNLDLQGHYKYCKEIFNTIPKKVEIIKTDIDYTEYITSKSEIFHITLHLPEIFCGACAWLIESAMKKLQFVRLAHVNLSQKNLKITWQGQQNLIDQIITHLNNLGYNCTPWQPELAALERKKSELSLLKRIGVAALTFAFVMILSICIWAGNIDNSMNEMTREVLHVFSFAITFPSAIYCAWPFFHNAYRSLKQASFTNMSIPITLAIIIMLIISIQEMILKGQYAYFDSALGLVFALLSGKYLEKRVINQASSDNYSFSRLLPTTADVLDHDNNIHKKLLKDLREGDIILVPAGGIIPIDGQVIYGNSFIDNSIISGESLAIPVDIGTDVIGGSINLSNPIRILCTHIHNDSYLKKIERWLAAQIAEKPADKASRLASRLTRIYTPSVLIISLIVTIFWYLIMGSGLRTAFYIGSSLLIITCPCAVGIAVPLANFIINNKLLKNGIFIKSNLELEKLLEAKAIFYDKTGTLTSPHLAISIPKMSEQELNILFSLSSASSHPISKAITLELEEQARFISQLKTEEKPGYGMIGEWNSNHFLLGSADFLNLEQPSNEEDCNLQAVYFKAMNQDSHYTITIKSQYCPSALKCTEYFKDFGMEQAIISGDTTQAVAKCAADLKIEHFHSKCLPEQKVEIIQDYQHKTQQKLIYVGDGLNDSLSMQAAHVGISNSSGTTLTRNAAGIVFTGHDLAKLISLHRSALKYRKNIKQNFALSLGYNALSIPLAAAGLVTPIWAALFMSISSLCVILNALRLKKGS